MNNNEYKWVIYEQTIQYNELGISVKNIGWHKEFKNCDKIIHNPDGAARIWEYGFKEYWINNECIATSKSIKSNEEWIIKQIIE